MKDFFELVYQNNKVQSMAHVEQNCYKNQIQI